MGLIDGLMGLIFGNGRNVVVETAGAFRENAEAGAEREAQLSADVLSQYGREFGGPARGYFDRIMDAINRLPRPAMALGTLGLFVAAMVDPVWFAARMQGIALVPEPLWWLLGAIVSFYFGARHQFKGQQFQQSIATTMALAPQVTRNIDTLRKLGADTPGVADTGSDAATTAQAVRIDGDTNAALVDWHEARQR